MVKNFKKTRVRPYLSRLWRIRQLQRDNIWCNKCLLSVLQAPRSWESDVVFHREGFTLQGLLVPKAVIIVTFYHSYKETAGLGYCVQLTFRCSSESQDIVLPLLTLLLQYDTHAPDCLILVPIVVVILSRSLEIRSLSVKLSIPVPVQCTSTQKMNRESEIPRTLHCRNPAARQYT
jgi:hypothetical protein